MTAPESPAYRLWRVFRCPESYVVSTRTDSIGLTWPVRHRVKCVRWRGHFGLCRSAVSLGPTATSSFPAAQSWAAVTWARNLSWWQEWRLDYGPVRLLARLRARTQAGPRRQSPPEQ